MPPQKAPQSNFLAKLGNRIKKAQQQLAGKEIDYGSGGELPAGINGVAELIKMEIGVVKEGKKTSGQHYFRAEGIVVLPIKDSQGLPIAGKRTSIMESLADTPEAMGDRKTAEDHWAWVRNTICKLAADPKNPGAMDAALTDAVEQGDDALNQFLNDIGSAGIYFDFRTWQPDKKNPNDPPSKIFHLWGSAMEGFTPPSENVTNDNSGQAPARPTVQRTTAATTPPKATNGPARSAASQPAQRTTQTATRPQTTSQPQQRASALTATPGKPASRQPAPAPKTADEIDPPNATGDEMDYTQTGLAELLTYAEQGDGPARMELCRRGMFYGMTEQETEEAANWSDIADFCKMKEEESGADAGGDDGESDGGNDETTVEREPLAVGHVVLYRPLDKKNQPAKVPVECEITAIDKRGNLTLKNMETNAVYKGVLPDTVEQQS